MEHLEAQLSALGGDHAALKESFVRFQRKSGMRWARSGGDELGLTPELLRKLLSGDPGANGGRSRDPAYIRDFGDL